MTTELEPMDPVVKWFLRSLRDHDTHYGELLNDGEVLTRCGVRFAPMPTLKVVGTVATGDIALVTGDLSLKGYPRDPDQVCPDCGRND